MTGQSQRGPGRPATSKALTLAERQAKARHRRDRQEGELLTLIAALDALATPDARARVEAIPTFAKHLKTARTFAAMLGMEASPKPTDETQPA